MKRAPARVSHSRSPRTLITAEKFPYKGAETGRAVKELNPSVLMTGILCLILFFTPGVSFAAQKDWKGAGHEIFAIGKALMKEGNEAAAREEAISRALSKGVENYLVSRLGEETVAENFSRVMNEIIPVAREGVGNFNILAEELVNDEYRVFVKIKINEKVLEKRLRKTGILTAMEGPALKVLFLVAEIRGDESSYWWGSPEVPSAMNASELFFNNAFRERGFIPINRSQGIVVKDETQELTALNLKDRHVIRWGRLVGADTVIYGETRIIKGEIVSLRIKAFDIRQETLIYQTVEAEPVEKGTGHERAVENSIEKLVKDVTEVLAPLINRTAGHSKDEPDTVMLTLKGLHSYKQYKEFRDFLINEIPGVTSVKQIRVRADAMSVAVGFKDGKNELVDRILGHENIPFPITLEYGWDGEVMLNVE